MARVVFTHRLPEGDPPWRTRLAGHALVEPPGPAFERDAWLTEVADADVLVSLLSERVDDEVFDRAPRLRLVANYAVGFDNVDVAAADRRGIVVTNTPGALTEATADFTWALLLATARRLGEGERLVRAGAWQGWAPELLLGLELAGRTLGLIGAGRIGRAVARRARGFGMSVVAADSRDDRRRGVDGELTWVALSELLARADVVSLHCPLTPATRGLIDRAALAAMRPGALLINTARGACVDEDAVAEALERGHLGGVGLDVFAHEPSISPRLVAQPRAVLAPHLGSATTTARVRMAELCIAAVCDVLAGREPAHRVRP